MGPSLFDLSGRTALVTGASKGIGFALAGALASAGARVVLNARDEARLAEARIALAAQGYAVEVAAFDVTDAAAVEAGVARVEAEVAAIDILVNNAGMQHRGPFAEFPLDGWRRLMATNVGSLYCGAGRWHECERRQSKSDREFRLERDQAPGARVCG